ncbi:MAG TPA: Flp family type IVb pilin [Rhodocyclaceae bacterium]|nr:Flp family type IVb pilin [Rhodocyclaceae bacterium]
MTRLLRNLLKHLASPWRDERGASAVEWAVLASCIAAVAIVGIGHVGQSLGALFLRALDIIRTYL